MKRFFIYIMTNKPYGTLYVGMTADLVRRVWQHKNRIVESFTCRYGLDRLVYYEHVDCGRAAYKREYCLKRWRRAWKEKLIEEVNPEWKDLYGDLL